MSQFAFILCLDGPFQGKMGLLQADEDGWIEAKELVTDLSDGDNVLPTTYRSVVECLPGVWGLASGRGLLGPKYARYILRAARRGWMN